MNCDWIAINQNVFESYELGPVWFWFWERWVNPSWSGSVIIVRLSNLVQNNVTIKDNDEKFVLVSLRTFWSCVVVINVISPINSWGSVKDAVVCRRSRPLRGQKWELQDLVYASAPGFTVSKHGGFSAVTKRWCVIFGPKCWCFFSFPPLSKWCLVETKCWCASLCCSWPELPSLQLDSGRGAKR